MKTMQILRASLLLVIGFVLFFGCRKKYECVCNVSESPYVKRIVSSSPKKLSKKHAQATCKATEKTLIETYTQNTCSTCSANITCTLN